MNNPDTAHQLDAEAVAAEVVYTMTNTQPSCSGRGESDRIPNTFREAMVLPQVPSWKAVLTMKGAVLYSNVMLELGCDKSFGSVPLYIDNTSPATAPTVLTQSASPSGTFRARAVGRGQD